MTERIGTLRGGIPTTNSPGSLGAVSKNTATAFQGETKRGQSEEQTGKQAGKQAGAQIVGIELSVAAQLRSLIAKRGSGLICWQDLASGDPSKRTVIQLALSNVVANRHAPDRDIPLQRVAQGIYHYGYDQPDPYQIALKAAGGSPEGVGYAGASAAHYLELRADGPAEPIIAFPRRVSSQPSGTKSQWVSRGSCIGRIVAGLNLPEVSLLESLRDPELVTISDQDAIKTIGKLLDREIISIRGLVKAVQTEPAVVKEGLRNLLLALDRDEAETVKPTLNKSVRDRAFLSGRKEGARA